MPIYTLACPECRQNSEHIMHHDEHMTEVKCPCCGWALSRHLNRAWMVDGPSMQMQGDTVPGGCSYDYYDENLGVRVKSKQHRKDEMLKQGLAEYVPDPEQKAIRDECRYIREHSAPADADAQATIGSLKREAKRKRTKKQIDKVFESAPLPPVTLN